jgi:hypothetical protein
LRGHESGRSTWMSYGHKCNDTTTQREELSACGVK